MKFEIGDVFSRTFGFVSQEAGALISIVALTYILPAILIYIVPFTFSASIFTGFLMRRTHC